MPLSNKKGVLTLLLGFLLALQVTSCAKKQVKLPVCREKGVVSWYGPGFHGRKTANGERYDQWRMTAAHKELPFGTMVKVVNLDNNKSIIVRINDRGPYKRGRIIDVSRAGAKKLGLVKSGTARVIIFYLPEEDDVAKEVAGRNEEGTI